MAEFGHIYHLAAVKLLRPPIKEIFASLGTRPNGETYDINHSLLELLQGKQFKGNEDKYPYQHVQLLNEICETFKLNAFTFDEMKLKLFEQTLTTEVKAWLLSHPTGTFKTWDKLCSTFLAHFYPERKSIKQGVRLLTSPRDQVRA